MRKSAILAATVMLAHLGFAGASMAEPLSAERVLAAQGKLSLSLLAQIEKTRGEGRNIVLSPASLAAMFLLLDIGSDAIMRTALRDTLAFTGSGDPAADFASLRDMIGKLRKDTGDKDTTFTMANVMVFDPRARPEAAAIERVRVTGARVDVKEITSPQTIAAINDWVSAETKGLIPKLFDEPPDAAGLIAANALYFKSLWSRPFVKEQTKPQPFFSLDGARAEVPTMHVKESIGFRGDGRFVAVDLPYKNGRFSVVVITTKDKPAPAHEFAAVTGWLGGQFRRANVDLALPRFTLTDDAKLLPALDALGLKAGRTSPTAFSGFSSLPLELSAVTQRTFLRVDEAGTEAAAATGGSIQVTSAAPPEQNETVTVDKPFLFALRDNATGLILMSAYVGRPDPINTASR